ncbi:glycosyltransferase family 39 protein [Patescibacteria group bacterium]
MLNAVTKFLKKHLFILTVVAVGVFFFFVYSWLFINTGVGFTSPDETANHFFATRFADTTELGFTEPLNETINDDVVHPRSTSVVNGKTVPATFLGMPLLYGSIAKIFGNSVIVYLTPFFAMVGVVFFYLLIKEVFSKRNAFISALLLFTLPPFWLYSARGMFHNVLFISLFIIGIYFLVKVLKNEITPHLRNLYFAAGGLSIGISLTVRTSEIIWVAVSVLVLFIIFRRKISWTHILITFVMVIITFIPVMYFNNQLYGTLFSSVYSQASTDGPVSVAASQSLLASVGKAFLPFGINFQRVGTTASQYLIQIFPWISLLTIVGVIWLLRASVFPFLKKHFPINYFSSEKVSSIYKGYLAIYLLIVMWLLLYYGSFEFYEFSDKTKIILGSSYLRYWLPIYIFCIPFISLGIFWVGGLFKKQRIKDVVIVSLVVLLLYFSIHTVVSDPLYGLAETKVNTQRSLAHKEKALAVTEPESVIISGHADKIFFPDRRVIVELPVGREERVELLGQLLSQVPVYLYFNPIDKGNVEIFKELEENNYVLEEMMRFEGTDSILFGISRY